MTVAIKPRKTLMIRKLAADPNMPIAEVARRSGVHPAYASAVAGRRRGKAGK